MLEDLLHSLGGLSPEKAALLLQAWRHPRLLKRGDYLSTPDVTDRYLYFVESGILRIFCVSPAGEDVSLGFSYDNTFIGSYPSLTHFFLPCSLAP